MPTALVAGIERTTVEMTVIVAAILSRCAGLGVQITVTPVFGQTFSVLHRLSERLYRCRLSTTNLTLCIS